LVAILHGKGTTLPKLLQYVFNRMLTVIKQYIKVVNFIRAARRLEDLFYIKSLHYEKNKGDLNGVDAVWINKQYRLLFNSSANDEGIVVNALLFEISKHYE
jgi:proteic killer suppression protein